MNYFLFIYLKIIVESYFFYNLHFKNCYIFNMTSCGNSPTFGKTCCYLSLTGNQSSTLKWFFECFSDMSLRIYHNPSPCISEDCGLYSYHRTVLESVNVDFIIRRMLRVLNTCLCNNHSFLL